MENLFVGAYVLFAIAYGFLNGWIAKDFFDYFSKNKK